MKSRILTSEILFDEPIDKVFQFFSEAENLENITPPFLSFKIMTPKPIIMKEGTLLDYTLKLHGIPIRWRTRINQWNYPDGFEDEQILGPYDQWIHRHEFHRQGDQTRMLDHITFRSPGWIFEPIINSLFVEKDLFRIFNFRIETMAKYLQISEILSPVTIKLAK